VALEVWVLDRLRQEARAHQAAGVAPLVPVGGEDAPSQGQAEVVLAVVAHAEVAELRGVQRLEVAGVPRHDGARSEEPPLEGVPAGLLHHGRERVQLADDLLYTKVALSNFHIRT